MGDGTKKELGYPSGGELTRVDALPERTALLAVEGQRELLAERQRELFLARQRELLAARQRDSNAARRQQVAERRTGQLALLRGDRTLTEALARVRRGTRSD